MSLASDSREALKLVTGEAVATAVALLPRLNGSPVLRRAALLEVVPALVGYYSDGAAALAADFYEDERDLAGARTVFTPELVVADRTVKLRSAVAWSAAPLFVDPGDLLTVGDRLAEVVQLDVARAYRDTITENRKRDPDCVGWRRVTAGGCKLCRMLADRGAIYKESTARFAAHPNCNCAAQPVFKSKDDGPEASVMQYMASSRSRTPAQRAELRAYLDAYY